LSVGPAVLERAAGETEGALDVKMTPTPTLPVGAAARESVALGGREGGPSPALTAEAREVGPVGDREGRAALETKAEGALEAAPVAPVPAAEATVPEVPVERKAEPAAAVVVVEDAPQDPAPVLAPAPAPVEAEGDPSRVEPAPLAAAVAVEASVAAAPPAPTVPAATSRDPVDPSGAAQDGSLAPSSGTPGAPLATTRSRWLVVAAAGGAALAIAVGLWLALGRAPVPAPAAAPDVVAAAEPGTVERAAVEPYLATTATAAPSASSTPSAPEPVASGASSAVADAAGPEPIRVRILISPPTGRVIEKGKRVGYSGVEVEVMPGKRRIFEVQHDGYTARRLVVDGSEPEIRIGLRPASGSPAPTAPADTAGAAPTATATPPRATAAPTPSGTP